MSKKWNVIHDCDGENGEPTVWSLEIIHPVHGKYCWISNMGDYFAVEVDDCGEITELAKCKSLTSAKRWVSMRLVK